MRATFDDATFVHDQYLMCINYRGQTMCDDQCGAVLRDAAQFVLNGLL